MFGPVGNPKDWKRYDSDREMRRLVGNNAIRLVLTVTQGVLEDATEGDLSQWQRCTLNETFSLCPTYPKLLYLPRVLDDATITGSAQFRSKVLDH